jgi:regulator of protease activity HflC (stomatin/prohibitin superfamily)
VAATWRTFRLAYNRRGGSAMTIFNEPHGRVLDANPGSALRLVGIAALAFVLVIAIFASVARVDSGHVGVLTLFGRVTGEVLPEGVHLINPLKANHELSIRTPGAQGIGQRAFG